MANTTNFGWETPDDTDLVKDGAAAMRTLGNSIDASFVDLKGGTTGQVLSKNSDTDMDFIWVAQDDSNAIQNAIVDAKGDLITATAADTPARLAVGTNGQVLTADSTTATGLKWGTVSAGGLTSLATGTLSGSTVSLTSISGSYKNLYLVVAGPYTSVSAGKLRLTVNADTGGNYAYDVSVGSTLSSSTGASYVIMGTESLGNNLATSNTRSLLALTIFDYANTTTYKSMQWLYWDTWSTYLHSGVGGYNGGFGAITSVQIKTDSPSFAGGTYTLYGVS